MRTDQYDPAPTIETEGLVRHQRVREECDHRHGRETNRLLACKRPPPNFLRHEFGDVGANCYQLDPDPGPCNESPKIEASSRLLKSHYHIGRYVPQQRICKNRPPPKPIGEEPARNSANKK